MKPDINKLYPNMTISKLNNTEILNHINPGEPLSSKVNIIPRSNRLTVEQLRIIYDDKF